MSYDNAEPKVTKYLISNGDLVDESGNVIAHSDSLEDMYIKTSPQVKKYLLSDGSVVNENNDLIIKNDYFKKMYDQAEPKVAKYLHADGTIDENPGSGSDVNLEDNKQVTISNNGTTEIKPSSDYDAMKKVTVTTNVPTINKLFCWVEKNDLEDFRYTSSEYPEPQIDKALRAIEYNKPFQSQPVDNISSDGSEIEVDGDWFIRSPENDINLI